MHTAAGTKPEKEIEFLIKIVWRWTKNSIELEDFASTLDYEYGALGSGLSWLGGAWAGTDCYIQFMYYVIIWFFLHGYGSSTFWGSFYLNISIWIPLWNNKYNVDLCNIFLEL